MNKLIKHYEKSKNKLFNPDGHGAMSVDLTADQCERLCVCAATIALRIGEVS